MAGPKVALPFLSIFQLVFFTSGKGNNLKLSESRHCRKLK
jgi:hypothetical protein